MDYQALKAEITKPDYDGLDDAAIAAALNAKVVQMPDRLVPISEAMEYLRTNNLWLNIKKAAATNDAAAAAVDLNEDPRAQFIDFNLPVVQAMLADLVVSGLLTQEQADDLVALKNVTDKWTKAALRAPYIVANDIAIARSLGDG